MQATEQTKKSGVPTGWIVAVLLVAGAWAGAYALRGSGDKAIMPDWADGLAAGQQVAQKTDKPMVVLFTAGWCLPCQQLKKSVLTQDQVHDALQAGFVPVQIDLTDQSANNPNLVVAQHYGVQGIPTVLAMTAEGKTIDMYKGAHTVEGFTAWLGRLSR